MTPERRYATGTASVTIEPGSGSPPPTGSWSPTSPPAPDGAQLFAVSCVSAGACIAVGEQGATSQPLVETLAGGVWTPSSPALPATAADPGGGSLTGVSCVSASACTAVGAYVDASEPNSVWPLVETLASGI